MVPNYSTFHRDPIRVAQGDTRIWNHYSGAVTSRNPDACKSYNCLYKKAEHVGGRKAKSDSDALCAMCQLVGGKRIAPDSLNYTTSNAWQGGAGEEEAVEGEKLVDEEEAGPNVEYTGTKMMIDKYGTKVASMIAILKDLVGVTKDEEEGGGGEQEQESVKKRDKAKGKVGNGKIKRASQDDTDDEGGEGGEKDDNRVIVFSQWPGMLEMAKEAMEENNINFV